MALFADFLSPYDPYEHVAERIPHPQGQPPVFPPTRLHLLGGSGHLLYICAYEWVRIIQQGGFRISWELREDCTRTYPLRLGVKGHRYRVLGLWETDVHLFGTGNPQAPLFLLGTDGKGRDLLSRLLAGSRVSLGISGLAVLLALLLASPLGALSGYFGGRTDLMIQGVVEGTLTFPRLALILVLASAVRGAEERLIGMTLLLALVGWAPMARMLRAQVLALREEGFIEAARALGAGHGWIVLRHLIPHLSGTIIISATLALPSLLMLESFLSYLGYGVPDTLVSWGSILQEVSEVQFLPGRPWLLWAGGAIALTALACTLVGETLRERFDPFQHAGK